MISTKCIPVFTTVLWNALIVSPSATATVVAAGRIIERPRSKRDAGAIHEHDDIIQRRAFYRGGKRNAIVSLICMSDLLACDCSRERRFRPVHEGRATMARRLSQMTVKRKITSRHGVDSGPLSEWLTDTWRAGGASAALLRRLAEAEFSATAKERFTCPSSGQACITRGYRDHSFTSRFHGNNTGAASAVVRKRWCTPRGDQNCEYSHGPEHRRTACP